MRVIYGQSCDLVHTIRLFLWRTACQDQLIRVTMLETDEGQAVVLPGNSCDWGHSDLVCMPSSSPVPLGTRTGFCPSELVSMYMVLLCFLCFVFWGLRDNTLNTSSLHNWCSSSLTKLGSHQVCMGSRACDIMPLKNMSCSLYNRLTPA